MPSVATVMSSHTVRIVPAVAVAWLMGCAALEPEFRRAVDCISPDGMLTAEVYWVIHPGATSTSYVRVAIVPAEGRPEPSPGTTYVFEASQANAVQVDWIGRRQVLVIFPAGAIIEFSQQRTRAEGDGTVEIVYHRSAAGTLVAECGSRSSHVVLPR
jgi:hypothetical protein